MAILYNLDPLAAMEIFYGGEKSGVWNGDFIKNEKQRGLVLPELLRRFLEDYGYLSVNSGGVNAYRIYHPDSMGEVNLTSEDGEISLLVVGALVVADSESEESDYWLAVRTDMENLPICFGEETDDGSVWTPTDMTLSGVLTVMFCAQLFKSSEVYVFSEADEIETALAMYGIEKQRIIPSAGNSQQMSICYDENSSSFIAAEHLNGRLSRLYVAARKAAEGENEGKYSSFSDDELENIFKAEFYGSGVSACNYSHALDIQKEIIARLERAGADGVTLAEHFKLAGRCCWALGQTAEAESWYKRGFPSMDAAAAECPEKAALYYRAAGCFYTDVGQPEKGAQMFGRSMEILREYSPDDFLNIGMLYRFEAEYAAKDDERLDAAIELYNKALEEFQKDTKNCKYEIARTQQLRGEIRRRKKELGKPKD